MDRINELLQRLSDLSEADIAELEGLILSEFDTVEGESELTTSSVERMTSLADALDNVRGELTRRTEVAEALQTKAAELATRVHGATDETPADGELAADDEAEKKEPDAEAAPEGEAPVAPATPPAEPAPTPGPPADPAAEEAGDEEDPEAKNKKKLPAPTFSAETPESPETPAEASDPAESTEPAAPAEGDQSESSTTQPVEANLATTAPEAPAEGDKPTEGTPPEAELSAANDPQETTMAQATDNGTGVVVTPPADAAPVPSPRDEGVGLTITAGADIPGIGTGAVLHDMDAVADAFGKRLQSIRHAGPGNGQQHVVASLAFDYPEDRHLSGDSAENIRKINRITEPQAVTAAAGICAPLETIYDIDVCGVADRPIRDALARFNADRGGVRIYGSPVLDCGSNAGTAPIWNPNSPATKYCCDAKCPTPEDVFLEAVYSCVRFSNFTNRFFPEVIKANTDLALIRHARAAEQNLIKKIYAKSIAATGKPIANMGFTRTMIRTILDASAWLRRVHRLGANGPIRVILPNWVQDALDADISQQMPGDGMEALLPSTPRLNQIFAGRGINITWALDDWTNTGDPGAVPAQTGATVGKGFQTTVSFPMFPEGSFLFLDGGTLDLGVQRDATMIGSNEYATFMETFESVAKVGCNSLWLTQDVCISGAAAALVPGVC